MTERVTGQIWAKATDDDRVNIQLILGDHDLSLTLDIEDAKSWSTAISKAVQDAVARLPVVNI